MADMSIQVAYGKINLSRSAGTLAAFKLEAPFKKTSAASSGKSTQAKAVYTPCTKYPEIGGGFSSKGVLHPEGTIIMMQASRTRNGMRVADGVLFLRLRAEAAFRVISARLPVGEESIIGDRQLAFQGSADLLTVDQLISMDIDVPHTVRRNYLNPDELEELFVIQVIREETVPAPSLVRIATSVGVKTVAMASEAPRRLRMRRPR